MATLLDGRTVRDARKEKLAERISGLASAPSLTIIQIGDRADSTAYIEQKKKLGAAIGVEVDVKQFPSSIEEDELLSAIADVSSREDADGIIVQLPLPEHLNVFRVIESIDPVKDVDGLTSVNVKKLQAGDATGFVPATAKGVGSLLESYGIDVAGKGVTVVGRSMLVGKPTAMLMLSKNATVTVAHSKTADLPMVTSRADVLIVAAGQPRLIGAGHVSEEQAVVDVGINLNTGESLEEEIPGKKFVGDVDFEVVKNSVSAISPVPGGVGPMTVVSLFENVTDAYERRREQQQ